MNRSSSLFKLFNTQWYWTRQIGVIGDQSSTCTEVFLTIPSGLSQQRLEALTFTPPPVPLHRGPDSVLDAEIFRRRGWGRVRHFPVAARPAAAELVMLVSDNEGSELQEAIMFLGRELADSG